MKRRWFLLLAFVPLLFTWPVHGQAPDWEVFRQFMRMHLQPKK